MTRQSTERDKQRGQEKEVISLGESQSAQHTEEEVNPLVGERISESLLLRGWDLALRVVDEAAAW